jgi:hypothetical protein
MTQDEELARLKKALTHSLEGVAKLEDALKNGGPIPGDSIARLKN